MTDGLNVVSVWIMQKRCIIIRMVLGTKARSAIICSARRSPRQKEGIDRRLRSCTKREMRAWNHWNPYRKPNITCWFSAFSVPILDGKTNRVGVVGNKIIAESRQRFRMEYPTFFEVPSCNSYVIDQNTSLKFCPDASILLELCCWSGVWER